jgi:hypothetical protein
VLNAFEKAHACGFDFRFFQAPSFQELMASEPLVHRFQCAYFVGTEVALGDRAPFHFPIGLFKVDPDGAEFGDSD